VGPLSLYLGLALPAGLVFSPSSPRSAASDAEEADRPRERVDPLVLSWEGVGRWVYPSRGRRRDILREVQGIAGAARDLGFTP
jgi:hypothetical protein